MRRKRPTSIYINFNERSRRRDPKRIRNTTGRGPSSTCSRPSHGVPVDPDSGRHPQQDLKRVNGNLIKNKLASGSPNKPNSKRNIGADPFPSLRAIREANKDLHQPVRPRRNAFAFNSIIKGATKPDGLHPRTKKKDMFDCLILTITDWANGRMGNPSPKQNLSSSQTPVQRKPKEKANFSRSGQIPDLIP
ncbi:hypothetical protein ACFX11_000409 [Malus domestica]